MRIKKFKIGDRIQHTSNPFFNEGVVVYVNQNDNGEETYTCHWSVSKLNKKNPRARGIYTSAEITKTKKKLPEPKEDLTDND
jgi:hypothetical protein